MRWSVRALVLLLLAVAGVKLWTYRLEHAPLPPPNPIVVKALSTPRPEPEVSLPSTYKAWCEIVRRQCTTALDTGPADWLPPTENVKHARSQELRFTLAKMAAPTPQAVERLKRETPLVRRMPYPFYSILSVP